MDMRHDAHKSYQPSTSTVPETSQSPTPKIMTTTTLVVGATGNTGKHVVQFLLDQGQNVKVLARSKDRMLSLLTQKEDYGDRLHITEATVLSIPEEQLKDMVIDCDAVVSCLGHNLTMKGMFGRADRRLVRDSVQRLTGAMPSSTKLILMGSDGVGHPDDDRRSFVERVVLFLLRNLIPPHADNEETAAHLLQTKTPEWCVVRPTDLQDGAPSKYTLYAKPPGSLFGSGIATRSNVAKFMVDLIVTPETWSQYKFQMPVLHDQEVDNTETN
jgi:putative NADH-flavin reductase